MAPKASGGSKKKHASQKQTTNKRSSAEREQPLAPSDDDNIIDEYESEEELIKQTKIKKENESSEPSKKKTKNDQETKTSSGSVSSALETIDRNVFVIVDAYSGKTKHVPRSKISSVVQLKHAICEAFKLKSVQEIESIRNLDDRDVTDEDLQATIYVGKSKGASSSQVIVIEDENSHSTKNLPPAPNHGYFIITLKSNGPIESSKVKANMQLTVDIVPHVNILIHGGDEYDFITALAEILDNSIQNTVVNKNERLIEIRFEKSSQSNHTSKLHIWDNGRGMNFQTLVHWATLGITDAPNTEITTSKDKPKRRMLEKYVTSDFSRYGVGSKKAIFNLGDEVTLVSKPKNSRFVYEVTLSRQKLEEEFSLGKDKQWKANCISRPPTDSEKQWDSFTHFTICDIKKVYVERYDATLIRRRLGHIYHYYIYGTDGNKKGRDIIEDAEDMSDLDDLSEGEEESGEKQKKKTPKNISDDEDLFEDSKHPRNVTIKVDGCSISDQDMDLETQYLQEGKSPFSFQIKLSVKNSEIGLTAPELTLPLSQPSGISIVNSTVRGIIYYYPFKQGRESLPIPEELYLEGGTLPTDQEVPLSERNPGFECFWNGRLLANERIKGLPFMEKERSNRDIPDNCYRRVKGMLFLDSNFEVSANKMYLCKQTNLCQALLNHTDRTLTQRFRKWIKNCHKKLDEEIIFDECDFERTQKEGKGLKTFYKKIKYGQTSYSVGDYVMMKTRPKIIGTIVDMFRDSTSEEYSVTIVVKEWTPEGQRSTQEPESNDKNVQYFPISKVQSLLSKQEFKTEISKMKNKLPSYIEVVDTPNVTSSREKRPPPDPVNAGFILKYLSACVMTGDHKVVTNQNIPITLTITYEGDDEEEKKLNETVVSTKAFKKGVHCFKPTKIRKEFTKVGTYIMELSTEEGGIKSKVVKVEVTSGGPSKLRVCSELPTVKGISKIIDKKQAKESAIFFIGKPFIPITIEQCDSYDNFVPFSDSTSELKVSTSDESITLSSFTTTITKDKRITISDLKVEKATFTTKFLKSKLLISYGPNQHIEFNMIILAGEAKSIELSEDSLVSLKNSVRKTLPDLDARLLDGESNHIFINPRYESDDDDCTLDMVITGDCLKNECKGTLDQETGYFQFKGVLLSEMSSSQRKDAEINFCHGEIQLSIPLILEAVSVLKPFAFRLVAPDREKNSIQDKANLKANVQVIVGSELVGWKIELLNEMYEIMPFDGFARASWSKKNSLPIKAGVCELPTLVVPQVAKSNKYTVDILSKTTDDTMQDDDELDSDMVIANFLINLRSIHGPPCMFKIDKKDVPKTIKCDACFTFKFCIMDTYGNQLNLQDEKEIYPELESITPQIEIVSQLNGEHEPIELVNNEKCKVITTETGFKYKNISLNGPCGEFHLKIVDANGKIKEDKIENLTLEAGPPVSLRINDSVDEMVFEVENYGTTPSFFVTSHDRYGNTLPSNGNFEIDPPESGIDLVQFEGEMNQSIDLQIENGKAYLPQFWVKGNEGAHEFYIECESITLRAKFFVKVIKGSHPSSIKILNKRIQLKAGDFLEPFEVMVIGENEKPVKAPSSLILEVSGPSGGEKRQFISCPTSKNDTYTFANSERQFSKSGIYRYKFRLDLTSLPNVGPLELPKSITESLDIDVAPAEPAALEIENDTFQLPVVTNSGDDIDKRSFWEELSLKVVDQYSNTVIADDKIKKVTISIEHTEDSADSELPEIEGQLESNFENGRAKFSRLSVKEGTGQTGLFKLVFSTKHLPPKELDFGFSDNTAVQEEEKELQQRRQTLVSELEYLKQEIKKADQNHQENEYKLNGLRSAMNEILKTLRELDVNFENDMPNLENIEKMLTILKKKIEIKTQNNRKTKECNVGISENKALQKVKQAQKEPQSGITGILGELGCVNDEKQNDTISRVLGQHMQCVVVENTAAMEKVRNLLEKFPNKLPVLPLDNILKCPKGMDNNGRLRLDYIEAEGFVGYAVNLIEIDNKKEMIRHAFWNLLGSTLVFESFSQAMEYRKKRLGAGSGTPPIVSLDGERLETSGIVYAGGKTVTPPMFRFGQTPPSENPEIKLLYEKKKKVEEYKKAFKETVNFENGEYAVTEQAKEEVTQKHKDEMKHIQAEIDEIDEELRNLRQGLTQKKDSPPKKKKKAATKKKGSPPSSPILFSYEEMEKKKGSRKRSEVEDEIEECPTSDRDEIEDYPSENDDDVSPPSKKKKKSPKAKKTSKKKK